MLARLALIAGALLAVACRDAPAPAAGPEFPELTGRVVDGADLLTPEQEARLAAASARLEREAGPQYVVVTVPTLQGYSIEDYGLKLGRHWGVGNKARNDGLLLIVAPNERLVRIEVGTGLEKRITNPFAAQVISEQALPRFRESRFPEGIEAASEALMKRLLPPRPNKDGAPASAAPAAAEKVPA
jgi:uncharacterized protein